MPPLAGTVQLRPDTGGDPLCRGGAQLFQRGKRLSHHCGWEGLQVGGATHGAEASCPLWEAEASLHRTGCHQSRTGRLQHLASIVEITVQVII